MTRGAVIAITTLPMYMQSGEDDNVGLGFPRHVEVRQNAGFPP